MDGVLTAGSGQQWESDLVASLERPGSPLTVIRRCADMTEVLASAATGRARALVVDGTLRRLDTDAVQRLQTSGVAVVGVHAAGDQRARQRLEMLGINALVADDAGPAVLLERSRQAIVDLEHWAAPPASGADPQRALPPPAIPPVAVEPPPPSRLGSVVAVWGPTGAPGRSTVAAGIADALAAAGHPTLLADADPYGGVLASAFGVLDESPGLAGACRLASTGRLAPPDLDALCWSITPTLKLLTGISRADRWPELRPSALPTVLAAARTLAPVTVVDTGFCIEADEELSFDSFAPRRNGITPGMERLVRALADLGEMLPSVRPEVVLNRVRSSAGSSSQARDALRRFTGITSAFELPEDRAATDKAWTAGISLSAAAPRSALSVGLRTISTLLLDDRSQTTRQQAAS